MISKRDIKEILLVMLLAALAIGIAATIEHAFYEYVFNDADQVEEQHVGWDSSYCRSTIDLKTGGIQWDCRKLSTPKLIQLMRGSKVVARA
jgi:hypothetical protein